jgi:hypothetical protein
MATSAQAPASPTTDPAEHGFVFSKQQVERRGVSILIRLNLAGAII